MRKFSLYFACSLTLVFIGCGDTSGDPTAQITLKADKTEVSPGGSAVITATVVKAVGTKADATAEAIVTQPGWGENVTFKLLTANGGQLSTAIQKTDGNGVAMTVYTAGNNYSNDTIQATLDNGMTASIVITKTGGITGARISKLEGPTSPVAENQTAVITATVTNQETNQPLMGEAVTFTIPTNASGACFINAANACVTGVTVNSDASGKAVAVYRAGGNNSAQEGYDTVRAALANGSSNAVVITRKALTPLSITVEALPPSVTAGQASIVTATLTGANNSGVWVSFTLPLNNSGATLSASGAITDGTGKAVVIYSAGANNPTLSVSDTVSAAIGSISASVVITRTGAAPLSYILTISANPPTLAIRNGSSLITANLKDTTGMAISGATVSFTCTNGTVGPPATTNGSGNAFTTYTSTVGAGSATTGIVTATWDVYSNSVVINIP